MWKEVKLTGHHRIKFQILKPLHLMGIRLVGMNCFASDICEHRRKNRILISLFVCFDGKKWLDIQLRIFLLIQQYCKSMTARITGGLPKQTSAGMLFKLDLIVTQRLIGNDFEDKGGGHMKLISSRTCINDSLKMNCGL